MDDIKSKYNFSEFGKKLIMRPSLEEGLPMISEYARYLVGAEHCNIFIHDNSKNLLWAIYSDTSKGGISIKDNEGIEGEAFHTAQPIIINDAYNLYGLFSKVLHKSDVLIRNVITVPILDSKDKAVGICQMINSTKGSFDEEDLKLIKFFSNFVKSYIELAKAVREREEKESKKLI